MFTLKQIQKFRHGETLQQGDCDYANELLQKHSKDEVVEFIKSWAQQYSNDIQCESAQAEEFERNAYGY